jgi:hypothetical protein
MSRSMSGVVVAAMAVWLTAVAAPAQTTTSSETKNFEVLAVDGNQLDVRLPEGTKEITVPDDFRFTVNGQQLSVHQLKVGMKGTATITTRTTLVPVTVTEIKNGTVVVKSSAGIIVRTGEGVKSFTQSDVDKRGVKIVRDGKFVEVAELREGDRLSATIITSLPPKVMTDKEVNATLAAAPAPARSASSGSSASASTRSAAPAAAAAPAPAASKKAPLASSAQSSTSTAAPGAAKTLPKTASSWPLVALASLLSIAMGLTLTVWRRYAAY